MSRIFRSAAMERLSTPEQLDQMVRVTRPASWAALAAAGCFVVGLLVWATFGRVTTRIAAQGLLLGGGIHEISPLAAGQITRILVRPGDVVRENDVIAEVAQPDLALQLANARSRHAELVVEHRRVEAFGSEDQTLQRSVVGQQRQTTEAQVRSNEERIAALGRQVATEEELVREGLITRSQLDGTRRSLTASKDELSRARAELTSLASRGLTDQFSRRQQIQTSLVRIQEAQQLVAQLEIAWKQRAFVTTTHAGTVVELTAETGGLATPGVPVAKLALANPGAAPLQAVLYVSTEDGKKIAPGMEINVAPATVKAEEYGYIVGRVLRVSEFPATTQSMQHRLKNDRLVAMLGAQGAPFEVVAELTRDAKTPSGFRWTSSRGPRDAIRDGTPAQATITTRVQRPITLIMPSLDGMLADSAAERPPRRASSTGPSPRGS